LLVIDIFCMFPASPDRDEPGAIIAGERDPEALAQKARTRMRRKIAQLREALDCSFFTPDHAFVLQMMLDNIDRLTAQIAVLDERIAILCEPYERQIAQLGIAHALLSDPGAEYRDLGTGYYEQRERTRHRVSSHVRSLERLGYKINIELLAPDAETGELITRTAS
jgi:hypothetical protein